VDRGPLINRPGPGYGLFLPPEERIRTNFRNAVALIKNIYTPANSKRMIFTKVCDNNSIICLKSYLSSVGLTVTLLLVFTVNLYF
jgi:hypothetical protein